MIFVSIASFRDKQLIKTVESCLKNAYDPSNIRIGIFWQYDDDEDISIFDNVPNVVTYKIHWEEAEGSVCWARYMLQQLLFNDEEYYFQVDSHTLFSKHWDKILLEIYRETESDKPIISAGPNYYFDLTAEGGLPPYGGSYTEFDGYKCQAQPFQQKLDSLDINGYFMYGFKKAEDLSKPFLGRHISAALLFTKGTWVREVPYDPNLYFQGEEGSLALRSFTRGYDIFAPNKIPIWHLHYQFNSRKRHWNSFEKDRINVKSKESDIRYKSILNGTLQGVYGLGYKRSMQDWINYSGVNLLTATATNEAYSGAIPQYV
jgi:hypothetical protein